MVYSHAHAQKICFTFLFYTNTILKFQHKPQVLLKGAIPLHAGHDNIKQLKKLANNLQQALV